MVLLHGMRNDALLQLWSVTMSMLLYPWDVGRSVTKSSAITWNGSAVRSVVIGNRAGFDRCVLILVIWQVVHPLMYCVMKSFIPGHQ
jgi:hypothetical protein